MTVICVAILNLLKLNTGQVRNLLYCKFKKIFYSYWMNLWVRSFRMIQIRINDPRSLGSWCIKRTKESTLGSWARIPQFLWCTMIRGILDHWSWSGSSQRNTPQEFLGYHNFTLMALRLWRWIQWAWRSRVHQKRGFWWWVWWGTLRSSKCVHVLVLVPGVTKLSRDFGKVLGQQLKREFWQINMP